MFVMIVEASGQAPGFTTSEKEIVGVASQLSVAVAVPLAAGEESSSHSMVASGGSVRIGTDVSSIVIV